MCIKISHEHAQDPDRFRCDFSRPDQEKKCVHPAGWAACIRDTFTPHTCQYRQDIIALIEGKLARPDREEGLTL